MNELDINIWLKVTIIISGIIGFIFFLMDE